MFRKGALKLNISLFMLAVCAGIIFLSCGFCRTVPRGVSVNGIEVGGLTRTAAAQKVRGSFINDLKSAKLEVFAGENLYGFTYPEINFKDNVYSLLKHAQKGASLTATVSYYLCGVEEIAAAICLNESLPVTEPYAEFSSFGEPFTYFYGNDGKKADRAKLIEDINKSLEGGFKPVRVSFNPVRRQKKLSQVKRETRLLSSFKTEFDGTNLNRVSNIRLAAAKLNGAVLCAGQTLSFNDIVGDRVKNRGFLPAKIIENGEFIEGVGGGVCQVSTTLYNAALLSGLKITEYHPHSLAVGYVPPSRDAMVSGRTCDLKITNNFGCPVYIRSQTDSNSVTFLIYGLGDGGAYSLSSEVTGALPAEEETTDDPAKVRQGKDGLTSEGYLTVKRGGEEKRILIRKDKYGAVKRVVLDGGDGAEDTENPPQNPPVG